MLNESSVPNSAYTFARPSWLAQYDAGTKIGHAQGLQAYSEYECVDGVADFEPEIEERTPIARTPMVPYASRTGTKQNLAAMRANGWHLLVSAKGVLRTEGFKFT